MKKRILSLLIITAFIGGGAFAQSIVSKNKIQYMPNISKGILPHKTTRMHKSQNWDATMAHLKWMEQKDPTLKARMAHDEAHLEQWMQNHQQYLKTMRTQSTITLPVVVHVLYSNSSENISDAQVQSQINATNLDYARQNADTVNTPAPFKSVASAIGIQFCLAKIDPNGNPTTGIVHKSTTVSSFGTNNAVKFSSQGGDDAWDVTKYLNIWVCNIGGGILGYGEFPTSQVSNTYGAVIQYNSFGTTGNVQSPYNLGRTLTHEFSHCFNLYHIWGDDNGACTGTDYCADTPNQANATYGNPTFPQTDACSPNYPGIMFMNYMDYSDDAAMNMFTADQAAREQASIANYYTSLETSTVCNANVTSPPVADFSANMTTIAPGGSVNFTDLSTNSPTSWSWTFTGGTPSSSTTQNPTNIVYNNVGTYTVALTATNSYGSNTATKTAYITVTNNPGPTCDTLNNFNNGTPTLIGSGGTGTGGSGGWGYISGNNNWGDLAKADVFSTPPPNPNPYLVTGVYMQFGKAYSPTNKSVTIKVWQNDGTSGAPGTVAGSTTVSMNTIASNISSGTLTYVQFSPGISISGSSFYVGYDFSNIASGDTVALVTNQDGQTNPGTAWELQSNNTWYAFSNTTASWGINVANAIYPVLCQPSGIQEQQLSLDYGVNLYPNPTSGILNANINLNQASNLKLSVYNVLGELITQTSAQNIKTGQLRLNLSGKANGIYMVKITNDKTTITKKVVVNH